MHIRRKSNFQFDFHRKLWVRLRKANGETVNEEREEYKAQIFNIHPQVAHGMGGNMMTEQGNIS